MILYTPFTMPSNHLKQYNTGHRAFMQGGSCVKAHLIDKYPLPGILNLVGIILRGLVFEGSVAESGSDCLNS